MEGFINDIEGLRKQLKFKKINILAHSFGSPFALNYCSTYPDNIKSLILVSAVSPYYKENLKAEKENAGKLTRADSAERMTIVNSEDFKERNVSAYSKIIRFGLKHQLYNPGLY